MLVEATPGAWWKTAVIYQIYIRSFADASGDGVGDINGIRAHLAYVGRLGVDAIWVTPWYPSPMADGGYDVADYRAIDPLFGTLDDADALIDEVHRAGLRIIIDLVPNHTSSEHPWFKAALAASPHAAERQRYHFRTGRGPRGSQPPNNWRSVFGGPAWTRVREPDGHAGDWYLHLFAPQQPDLNWDNPEVRAEFESVLRFWLERGIDGFRIDVAHGLMKTTGLPDVDHGLTRDSPGHPHWDVEGVHDIYRAWRIVSDSFAGERIFVAEAWTPPDRVAQYVRQDELHTAFNFNFLDAEWDADALRSAIDRTIVELDKVGGVPTWVLSNHDVTRHLSRYAGEAGRDVGLRRARAAALLMFALPGSAYIYQGEELGLWEVDDLPEDVLQDPFWERSGHTARGRDGCRVPLPWSGSAPPFGFSPRAGQPWLPQPDALRDHSVERESGDPDSMLELYRAALRVRRQHAGWQPHPLGWREAPTGVLAFTRGPRMLCIANLSQLSFAVPPDGEVLLCSERAIDDNRLPPDTCAWVRLQGELFVSSK
jgi:alpha-glucosidase